MDVNLKNQIHKNLDNGMSDPILEQQERQHRIENIMEGFEGR